MTTVTSYQLLDGKRCGESLREKIRAGVAEVKASRGRVPHLAAVLVGNDGASRTYVESKVKACEEVGFRSSLIRMPETTTEDELLARVKDLNKDRDLDGFIVQLPLPSHIDPERVTLAMSPAKDVDGFHPENIGRMVLGLDCFLPATPSGIIELLRFHHIGTAGMNAVVVGRSHIVGTPMSILLSRNAYPGNCTVTLAHSRSKDLASITRRADILVAAVGKPEMITADMVKEGAVVIDVGIHRIPAPDKKSGFRLVGDVKFDEVAPKCSWISPVPGGVGPMTITSLLMNTLKAAQH